MISAQPIIYQAIFLDRDGTINKDSNYTYRIEDLQFEDGAIEGLKLLSSLPYLLIITTGQSGIGRGYYTENDFHKFMTHLSQQLEDHGVSFDAIYFCPHEPKANCACRKPKTGMILQAILDFRSKGIEIDLPNSIVIGDKTDDGKMGNHAGCRSILVRTGNGGKDGNHECVWAHEADNLLHAAQWVAAQKEVEQVVSNPL
ncbi:MAG: HAD family hydrolase [Chlamydiales bacterium]|nr:HAD family hydrolase [Chlamydiales bacterium]